MPQFLTANFKTALIADINQRKMKKIPLLLLLIFSIISTHSFAHKKMMKCTIKGLVLNRDSKVLTIRKTSESFRSFLNNYEKIEIRNGKFEHTFSYSEAEAYELIFEDELNNGAWRGITFFPINGTVQFRLHPQENWDLNEIKGGKLNAEYKKYQEASKKLFAQRKNELQKISSELQKQNEYNSPAYEEISRQIGNAKSQDEKVLLFQKRDELEKTHGRYTEKAKRLFRDPYDSLIASELTWKYDYMQKNPSLLSYFLLWSDVEMQLKRNFLVAKLVESVYADFEEKYPDHSYTKLISAQLEGLRTITPGKKYIDLKAPSVTHNDTLQLSAIINNHVTLIDLWGSWCGPCIAKTRLVFPIYEKYKDKGFKIVGIAREFTSTDAVKKRIEAERYPWENLYDLDDKLNIWNQYGISNGVGLMVLVDKDGTVLSVDPKPEDLEKILNEKLN